MNRFAHLCTYSLMAFMMSSCFAPTAAVSGSDGACASSGVSVYGVWKQITGYPSQWNYGGATPSKTQLTDSYRIMIVERGGQMCGVAVISQGVNVNPTKSTVFRAQYAHAIEQKSLEIDYTFPPTAATQDVTYAITGCGSRPILTLTYTDGRTATFEVFSRTVSSGQCQNSVQ